MPEVRITPSRSASAPRAKRLARWAGACLVGVSLAAGAASMDDWWFYVRNDFIHRLQPLLKEGADPNRLSPEGEPTIVEAVRTKAWKTYEAFIVLPNINLEATNKEGENALMLLSVLGETDRAKDLLSRGAQVNKLGWTPLHYAASRNKQDIAKLLISRGAIINAPSPDGTTPLMMAALSKSDAMVDLLLRAGADPTTRNLSNLSAADWARSANADKLAEKLEAQATQAERQRSGGAASATGTSVGGTSAGNPSPSSGSNAAPSRTRFESADPRQSGGGTPASGSSAAGTSAPGASTTRSTTAPSSNDDPAPAGSVGGVSNLRFGTD